MKKFIQIFLVVILVFVIAAGAFLTVSRNAVTAGGGACPMVGWNTRSLSCRAELPTPGFQIAKAPPPIMDVGWNS